MELLKNLNAEQKRAVIHGEGPLLLVAGAGTGKTTVVTKRIAWLITEQGCKPDEILALTFTEKAASEMQERVDQLLPYGYVDLWISTFHSFCRRVLEEYGMEIGLPDQFRLLTQTEQWMLVRQNIERFNLEYYRPLGNPTRFIHALLRHFSRAKDELVTPEDYLRYAEEVQLNQDRAESTGNNFQFPISNFQKKGKPKTAKINNKKTVSLPDSVPDEDDDPVKVSEIAHAYYVYQQLLVENDALDYGDLINSVYRLCVERPNILKQFQKRFSYILVDEFQDTNFAQYELVKMIAGNQKNVTVVGDDDQSIYRFRGASMSNILLFKKDYPESTEISLMRNYRSGQIILDTSYAFIQQNNPNRLEVQLGNRISKKLVSEQTDSGKVSVNHFIDAEEEANDIVNKITRYKISPPKAGSQTQENSIQGTGQDTSVMWNDFAILVRANSQADMYEKKLSEAGIPYQFVASSGLYTKAVVLDVVNYLKLLDNHHESPSMWRVLTMPIWNFAMDDLIGLSHFAQRKNYSLFLALRDYSSGVYLSDTSKTERERLLRMIANHTERTKREPASVITLSFLNESGYLKHLTSVDDQYHHTQISYLNQFYKKIQQFESATAEPTVRNLIQILSMEMASGEAGSLAQDFDAGPDMVKIMTIHGAKGLEFDTVFIPQLVDKRFPSIARKDPIELPKALIKDILPEGDYHLEEERRLFYVALTRAKRQVFLSYADDYGGVRAKKPSRFLYEMGFIQKEESRNKIQETKKNGIDSNSPLSDISIRASEKIGISTQNNYQLPSKFSYSQIKAFDTCPYQYRFAHVLKIPVKGNPAFSFGQSLHVALQKFFERVVKANTSEQGNLFGAPVGARFIAPVPTQEEFLQILDEAWISDWYQSAWQEQGQKKKAREMVKVLHEEFSRETPKVLFLEKGFTVKVPSTDGKAVYTFIGKIDRIDRVGLGEQDIELTDYKTGTTRDLDTQDKRQLLLYQIAAKEILGLNPVKLTYHYLEENKKVHFLGSEKEINTLKIELAELVEEMKTSDFRATPSQHICQYCDFRDICEYRAV